MEPEQLAVGFAAALRRAGIDVPIGSVIAFVDALGVLDAERRAAVYWAGRATLVHDPAELQLYDLAFASFWEGMPAGGSASAEPGPTLALLDDDEAAGDDGDAPAEVPSTPAVAIRYSAVEVLRHKDFAAYSAEEHDEARRLMADLRLAGALRRSRRTRPTSRGRLDLRRTVRRALRTGGEPIRRAWSAPAERRRRVVVLCDISGSMEPYARALLRFVHAAVASGGDVHAFALGTRLTPLTRQLRLRDPDAAMTATSHAVSDWSGGTRLGEGLRSFNDRWGVRGVARGAVVVIMSDGWDRGDPQLLAQEMGRLHRVAHRIVWVNPLIASPGYAPLARGMAAALPFVDEFVEGHSLAALESLAEVIGR